MIRLSLIFFCYLAYGNFDYIVDYLIIFSLINIAFFSFLKEKKIYLKDFIIFILSSYVIELFLGFPLFISVIILSLPLLLLSYFINNFFIHYSFVSIFLFILSIFTFYFLYPEILLIMKFDDYMYSFLVLIFLNIGLRSYGKKQS